MNSTNMSSKAERNNKLPTSLRSGFSLSRASSPAFCGWTPSHELTHGECSEEFVKDGSVILFPQNEHLHHAKIVARNSLSTRLPSGAPYLIARKIPYPHLLLQVNPARAALEIARIMLREKT